ncbi:hypothetical protein SEA_PIPER2020_43 [Mycobacterium phage Piper2020]|nr:hypothetical protein SEA_PIPER2020_43 [Mycobacterium phage Piper2020]QKO03280.1 hypothetical protein SEA_AWESOMESAUCE_43 [Mycobacterium phage Awesomesauce]
MPDATTMLLADARPSRAKSAPTDCRVRHQTWAAPPKSTSTVTPRDRMRRR